MIQLLLLPLLACLLLAIVHVYFGSIVLKRGVIFIDLALAQWAALGYLVGHWLHVESTAGLFMFGFAFTVFASVVLTLLRPLYNQLNLQEAVIGVTYILGTTLATTLIATTGMESHHLKDMLAGHILFIQGAELLSATILYALIMAAMVFMYSRMKGASSALKDLLFYILFGLVVTSSVKMVGVLLVFSYLVLPLLTVMLVSKQEKHHINLGWGVGVLGSVLGLAGSVMFDLPPSYAVILALSGLWAVAIVGRVFQGQGN